MRKKISTITWRSMGIRSKEAQWVGLKGRYYWQGLKLREIPKGEDFDERPY